MEGLIFGILRYPPIGELACKLRLSPLNVPTHLQKQTFALTDSVRPRSM